MELYEKLVDLQLLTFHTEWALKKFGKEEEQHPPQQPTLLKSTLMRVFDFSSRSF